MVELARFAFSSCPFPCHEVLEQNPGSRSISDDFDQNALPTPPVELAVKDLLPGAKVESPVGNRHDDLAAHHLALQMGVSVVPVRCPGQASPVRLWR
jgi:hypothetical protein